MINSPYQTIRQTFQAAAKCTLPLKGFLQGQFYDLNDNQLAYPLLHIDEGSIFLNATTAYPEKVKAEFSFTVYEKKRKATQPLITNELDSIYPQFETSSMDFCYQIGYNIIKLISSIAELTDDMPLEIDTFQAQGEVGALADDAVGVTFKVSTTIYLTRCIDFDLLNIDQFDTQLYNLLTK